MPARPARTAVGLLVAACLSGGPLAAAAEREPVRPAAGGLRITEQVEYYDLDATGLGELRRQLTERAPIGPHGRADALASVELQARYELAQAGGGCRAHRIEVRAHIVVLLPRWLGRAWAPDEVAARWSSMEAGLRRHEEGHRQHAREAAERLYQQLAELPLQPDCVAARRRAESLVQRSAIALEMRGLVYDRRTDHGRTQGAVL